MSLTPYEIRLEAIKIAQDQANQRFYQAWENRKSEELTEVPEFPSVETLLLEANKIKTFIDKG